MFCSICGQKYEGAPASCPKCGAPISPPVATYAPPPPGGSGIPNDPAMRMILPVGRSPLAIAAGYLGLFSFGCAPLAPVAVVVSILAMRDIKKHPDRHGMGRAIFGVIAGGLVTIGAAIIMIAVALSPKQ